MISVDVWWDAFVPEELGDEYVSEILSVIKTGFISLEWVTIEKGDLVFEITRTPLAAGVDQKIYLFGLSAEAVDRIANELGDVMSPTPQLWDFAAEQQAQIGPFTLPELLGVQNGAVGMTKKAAKAHSDALPQSRELMSACCKTYVLHPHTSGGYREGYACEYGWKLPGPVGWGSRAATGDGYVVQSAQYAHSYLHFWDYSMGAVYVKTVAKWKGKLIDLREIVSDPLWLPEVASVGPVPYIRHPDLRSSPVRESEAPTNPSPVAVDSRPLLHMGSRGSHVRDWQRILIRAGYSLAPYGVDGIFGPLTHNATVGFQKDHGVAATGVVGPLTWGQEYEDPYPISRKPKKRVILAKNYTVASRSVVDNIVIHTIQAVEASTTAENCAMWFAGRYTKAPLASAHYCIDDDSYVLCVAEEHVAWAAPGLNRNGIQLEHAGYARQSLEQWCDPFSRRMLHISAKLCAEICKRWDIPAVFVDAKRLVKGERGITTHYQVTKGPGKGKTTHVDPGQGFPMSWYLDMVQRELRR